jgi:hypothetical protein
MDYEADITCQEYPILVIFSQSGQVLKSLRFNEMRSVGETGKAKNETKES